MPLMREVISILTSNKFTKTFGITCLNYSGGIPSEIILSIPYLYGYLITGEKGGWEAHF